MVLALFPIFGGSVNADPLFGERGEWGWAFLPQVVFLYCDFSLFGRANIRYWRVQVWRSVLASVGILLWYHTE